MDRGCGIGMRRLSIIDLTTGHQPISNEDGTVWIVFNGEIYNYQELRAICWRAGHRFRTAQRHRDDRSPVRGGRRRGSRAAARHVRLRDLGRAASSRLLLARDRFGKKPLYYAVLPNGIYFGSEIEVPARRRAFRWRSTAEALRLYFQFGYIPDPLTAYRAIRKLPAGGWLDLRHDGAVTRRAATGSCRRRPPKPRPAFTRSRGGYRRVREDVRRSRAHPHDRRRAARRLPERRHRFQLGGGIHGAAVAGAGQDVLDRLRGEPASTSCPTPAMVADKYRTDHHEIMVRPDSRRT